MLAWPTFVTPNKKAHMRSIITPLAFMAFSTLALAQTAEDTKFKEDALASAKARTAQLVQELGLTPEQAEAVSMALLDAEMKAVTDRMQCAAIEARVKSTLEGGYDAAMAGLTPEQQTKLNTMRKNGAIDTSCCAGDAKTCDHGTSDKKAGCSGETGAKAGCCAGKAGAHGSTAAPAHTLDKAAEPAKAR